MAHNSTYERALEELGYRYAYEHTEFAQDHDFQALYEYFVKEYYMADAPQDATYVWHGVACAWAEMKKA